MIDQITLLSNPPPSQNTDTNPSNPSDVPPRLNLSSNLLSAASNAETMKIYKLPIEEIASIDPELGIRRALTIDSKFICYINTENSVVIKSIDYAFLSFTVRGPQAQVMDVCLFEGANFSVLGVMYKDGTLSGYQIGINEAGSSIIVRHFLGYKIEGIIERPLIMWKDLSKIGVCLRNELILIEVSVEGATGATGQGQEKTKDFEQELKPNKFNVLSFEENIKDFCFSPKYHLVYILFENNVVKVTNTENGFEIRGFQPYSDASANIRRLLSFKNLAKKGGSLPNASQKPGINKDHDYSLKDIFITITESCEIKVWDLSEWDNKTKTYYCIEELKLNENNNMDKESLAFSFFDPARNALYIVCSQKEEGKGFNVAILGINSFFQSYQENYKDQKKTQKFFTSTERIAVKETRLVDIAALNTKASNEAEETKEAVTAGNIQIQASGPKAKYNFVVLTGSMASFVSVFNFAQLPYKRSTHQFSTQIPKKASDSPMRRSSSLHEFSPKELHWEPKNLENLLSELKLDENILKKVLESSNNTTLGGGITLLGNKLTEEEQKLDLLSLPVPLVKARSEDLVCLTNKLSSQDSETQSPPKKSPKKKKTVEPSSVQVITEIIPSDPTPLEASVLDIPEPSSTSKKSKKKKKKEAAALAAAIGGNQTTITEDTKESASISETNKVIIIEPPTANSGSGSKKAKNKEKNSLASLPLLSPTQSTGSDSFLHPESFTGDLSQLKKKAPSPVSSVTTGMTEVIGKKVIVKPEQVAEHIKQWVQGFVDKKVVGFEKKIVNIDEIIEKKFAEKVESKLQAIEQRVIAKAQETMQKNLTKALEKPYQSINRINQINQQMKQAFETEKKGYQLKIKQQEDQIKKFKEEVNQTLNGFTQIMTVTLQSLSKSQLKVQELELNLQNKSTEVSSLIQYTKVMLQQEEEYRNRVHTLEKNVQFIAKECLDRLEANTQETPNNPTTDSILLPSSELIKEAEISDGYKKVVQDIFDSVRQMNTPEQINKSLAIITNNLNLNNSNQTLRVPTEETDLSRRSSTHSPQQQVVENPGLNPLATLIQNLPHLNPIVSGMAMQQPLMNNNNIPLQFPTVAVTGRKSQSEFSPKQQEGEFIGPLEFPKDPMMLFPTGPGGFNMEVLQPTKSRFMVNFVDSSNASVKDDDEERPDSYMSRPPGLDYYSESGGGESLNNLLPRDLLLDDNGKE